MDSMAPKSTANTQISALFGVDFSSGTMAGFTVTKAYSGLASASILFFICSSIT